MGRASVVDERSLLSPVTSAVEVPCCVHGTDFTSWGLISGSPIGLSRMGRNHIHFAVGEPGTTG